MNLPEKGGEKEQKMFPDRLFSLNGKRALVTGSSRGIGRAIAFALAGAGAEVIFHGSRESAALSAAFSEARKNGWDVRFETADLNDARAVEFLAEHTGPVDILVLNASFQKYQTVEDFSGADFDAQFQVNLGASFRLIRAFIPGMTARKWGRVLALGSVNEWKPSPRLPVYAATKAALSNLMRNCAKKYGPEGITFNTLSPGVMDTDRNREVLSDAAAVETLLKNIPARRFGTPEDCAAIALLLCSDAGSYLTGCDIPVAGGMQL